MACAERAVPQEQSAHNGVRRATPAQPSPVCHRHGSGNELSRDDLAQRRTAALRAPLPVFVLRALGHRLGQRRRAQKRKTPSLHDR